MNLNRKASTYAGKTKHENSEATNQITRLAETKEQSTFSKISRQTLEAPSQKTKYIRLLSWLQNYALGLANEWRTSPRDDGSVALAYRGSSSVAESTIGWRLRGGLSRTSKRFTRSGKAGRRSATVCQQSAIIRYLKKTKQPTASASYLRSSLPQNQSSATGRGVLIENLMTKCTIYSRIISKHTQWRQHPM